MYDTTRVVFLEPNRWSGHEIATQKPDPMPDQTVKDPTDSDLLCAMQALTEGPDELAHYLDERLGDSAETRHKWLRMLFIHLVLYTEQAKLPHTERSLVNTLETLIAETGTG